MDKPKTFLGTPPTPQHAQVAKELEAEEEAKKEAEIEAKIQPVIKAEIEEVTNPPKPLEWWLHWGFFWGMLGYIIITSTMPVLRTIKYNMQSSKEIEFTKNHPDYAKLMMDLHTKAHAKADETLKGLIGEIDKTY